MAVLNADDARVRAMAARTTARGSSPTAPRSTPTSTSRPLRLDDLARPRFTVRTPWGTTDVELAVSGAHMALNAAAAIAAAGTLGVDAGRRRRARCATATVTDGRMQCP